jgi:hypothetical protein
MADEQFQIPEPPTPERRIAYLEVLLVQAVDAIYSLANNDPFAITRIDALRMQANEIRGSHPGWPAMLKP